MIRKKSTPREVDFWYCDLRLESSAGNFIIWIDFFCGIVDLVVGNAGSHFRGVTHSFWNFGDVVQHTRSSARYTEGFNFKRLNWYFFWGVELWYIVVWVTICTIYELTLAFLGEWSDVFPDNFFFWGYFEDSGAAAFGDHGVAVRQTLSSGDQLAVESGVGDERTHAIGVGIATDIAPNNLEGGWVDFEDTAVVTDVNLGTVNAHAIRQAITSPAAVVEDQDIAFAWQTLWNHVNMVLTNDLADAAHFLGFGEVWTELPNDLAGFFVDDGEDVGFTCIPDDVVWFEAFVACIVPFVRPKVAHGVDMHPVTEFTVLGEMLVRVAEENVLCSLGETEFTEVINDSAIPKRCCLPSQLR